MMTTFPYRYIRRASATTPVAAAATGVPFSFAMSVPVCGEQGPPLIERMSPKPFVIGPGAGSIHAPDQCRSGVNLEYTWASVARSLATAFWSDSKSILDGGSSMDSYWKPPSLTVSVPAAKTESPDFAVLG